MTYVISDIHGCYDKYIEMLEKINFSSEDTLYILGDVIDRGPNGIKIMLDIMQRPNVVCLKGNHEAMAIDAMPHALNIIRTIGTAGLKLICNDAVDLWFHNGGEITLSEFLLLPADKALAAWEYMQSMQLFREIEIGERKFVLVHGGLENFSQERPLNDYKEDEIVWFRPEEDTVFYPDKYVIFGHTPVQLLDANKADKYAVPEIYHNGNLIDIDCGCVFSNGRLGCLCLDTMEEFYV